MVRTAARVRTDRSRPVRISESLYRFADTCNVYAVRSGREAVLIDFGSGDILDHLGQLGVDRVTDVLVTHHHRDQVQGLARAAAAGIRIWVPPVERDLISGADEFWQMRRTRLDYNVRQDRFSLLNSVPVTGALPEYRAPRYGDRRFRILPTPGHTVGSVSILTRVDGRKVCFSGDLIYGPGKVWSMAATQWSYTGAEGSGMSVLSLLDLRDRRPDVLLPSHGAPMEDPAAAIDLLVGRFGELFRFRERHPYLDELRASPYEEITPHLLSNRTSVATSYVLKSESGKGLMIDFGYDFTTGLPAGSDRSSRRPWLYTIGKLREHGVLTIDVALPTHYHDDHVAGFNLLREALGTSIWVPQSFVELLQQPDRFGVPCLWFDAISADAVLPMARTVRWEEYELTLHELPGHTLWEVAIEFEVDGLKVLATGDHQQDRTLNYTYANRLRRRDFIDGAALYRRLGPDLIISGHWVPVWVDETFLADIEEAAATVDRLHRELLPVEEFDFEADGLVAWLDPYEADLEPGGSLLFRAEVRNPFDRIVQASLGVVVPDGWGAEPPLARVRLQPKETGTATFIVCAESGPSQRRARVAVDVTIDGHRFGQQAEALVTVA